MYVQPTKPNEIYHFGIKRRSGRYPYGSGERPYQDRESGKKTSKYEVKEVSRLKTAISNSARSVAISTIGAAAGISVVAGTQNYILGLATYSAVVGGLLVTPLGKKKIYFKN